MLFFKKASRSAPNPTAAAAPSQEPMASAGSPAGFAPPPGGRLKRKMRHLKRQLRQTHLALGRQRWHSYAAAPMVEESEDSLPELPALEEGHGSAVSAPSNHTQASVEDRSRSAPSGEVEALQQAVVELRLQLRALAERPVFDPAAVPSLALQAPAFTEVQYEVVDLRHQLQALQQSLAAICPAPGMLSAAQLSIQDEQGRSVAGISSDGVVSCSSVMFRSATA